MGEIYRSVLVTGVRRLEAERAARVRNDKPERDRREPGAGEIPEQQQPGELATAGQAVSQPDVAADATRQADLEQDLLAVLQRRVAQLEQEAEQQQAELSQLQEERLQLRAELERRSKQERDRGYSDGFEEAKAAVMQEQEAWREEYAKLRSLFSSSLETQLEHVDRYAVDIAFASLGRIVGERYLDANFSAAVVREALQSVRGSTSVKVHVSQQDYDLIRDMDAELADQGQFSDVELVPDPRVSVGGCLIESETGSWDARLETQLQRLRDAIEQSLKSQQ